MAAIVLGNVWSITQLGEKSHFALDVPNVIVLGVKVYDFEGDDVASGDLYAFVHGAIRTTTNGF
jgi:hypothetical protein